MTDLIERLSSHLLPIETLARDHTSGGGFSFRQDAHPSPATRSTDAAVMVAVLASDEPEVLFTVRSAQMPHHAGQVALPGGRHHAGEAFPMATALREAQEEVGLEPDSVQVLGGMEAIDTLTGFRVTPVVGWVDAATDLRACDREVQTIFTLPLAHVLDHANYSAHRVRFRAGGARQSYRVWSLRGRQWPIWGATAWVLARLSGITVDAP